MRNAKRTVVVVALIALLAIPAMFAYFTDASDVETNKFTFGDLTVTVEEDAWNYGEEGVKDIVPNQTIAKDPKAVVEGAKAWVFMAVDQSAVGTYIEELAINDGWTDLNKTDAEGRVVYAYDTAIEDTETATLFDNVETLDTIEAQGGSFNIEVVAYAVQKEGFDTAADAWAATFGK